MKHASVEVGGASGYVRETQYDVLTDKIACLIHYDAADEKAKARAKTKAACGPRRR